MTTVLEKLKHSKGLLFALKEKGLEHITFENEAIGPYTSFGVGGYAEIMIVPTTVKELQLAYRCCLQEGTLPRILGGGYNLMVLSSSIPVVISTKKLRHIKISDNKIEVTCGSQLPLVVRKAVYKGLALESFVGIPGTVGGSIVGNAGSKPEGKHCDIGDFVSKVTCLDKNGQLKDMDQDALSFSYRNSSLRSHLLVSAELVAPYQDPDVCIERWKRFFANKSESQPFRSRSAGCVFKNPTQSPAWQLIHKAGLAGKQIGRVAISSKHANFIVNLGGACAEEVWELLHLIRTRVHKACGVDLALEVQIW